MKSSLRKLNCLGLILLVCSLLLSALPCPVDAAPAKNVILLMTDGTSSTHITLTRWYKGAPLALDSILVGGLRTYSAESIITDSAPAATAFATGYKSNSKFIGVLPEKTTVPGVSAIAPGDENKPVATVLEGARLLGKSVGLVATSQVQTCAAPISPERTCEVPTLPPPIWKGPTLPARGFPRRPQPTPTSRRHASSARILRVRD